MTWNLASRVDLALHLSTLVHIIFPFMHYTICIISRKKIPIVFRLSGDSFTCVPSLYCLRLIEWKSGGAVVIKARESGKCFVTFWVYKGKEKKNFDGFPSQNLFFFSSDVNIWCFRRFNEDIKANIFGENGKLLETLAPTGENSHFSYEHFITFNWNNSSSQGATNDVE